MFFLFSTHIVETTDFLEADSVVQEPHLCLINKESR